MCSITKTLSMHHWLYAEQYMVKQKMVELCVGEEYKSGWKYVLKRDSLSSNTAKRLTLRNGKVLSEETTVL